MNNEPWQCPARAHADFPKEIADRTMALIANAKIQETNWCMTIIRIETMPSIGDVT
jgi:hypothetical protein